MPLAKVSLCCFPSQIFADSFPMLIAADKTSLDIALALM